MKKTLKYLIILIAVPSVVAAGFLIFGDKQYAWISLCAAVISCIPFFISFETRDTSTKELVLLAVMTALSVTGRFAFSFLPHFKPVTAIVVITGIYLGPETGFLCGSLSAVVSNFIFGQGPWTPFQMFAWGLTGFFGGLLSKWLQKNIILLLAYGAVSGILYSAILDVWTTIWYDNAFNLPRYAASFISSLPTTGIYVLSNIVFLLLISKPIGSKLSRIKIKYGLK